MTAIMLRELRRLVPFSAALLVATALAGLVDISVNRGRTDPLPIAFWFGLFFVALTGIGAGLLAQTGASAEQRFLGLWPVRRATVWLARAPLHLLLAGVTAFGIMAIAIGVPALAGHGSWRAVSPEAGGIDSLVASGFPAAAVLGFALSLFWSQLLAAGWSVVLTILTLCGVTFVDFLLGNWVGPHLGPWLRVNPAAPEQAAAALPWFLILPALTLSAAAAVLFIRLPLLETRRRAGQGLLALPAALLLAGLIGFALMVDLAPVHPVTRAATLLTTDGRYAVVQAETGTPKSGRAAAVWSVETATRRVRLLCRNAAPAADPSGHQQTLWVFDQTWVADLDTGALRRLDFTGGLAPPVSPGGHYEAVLTEDGEEIRGDGTVVSLPPYTQAIGWARDESAFFTFAQRERGNSFVLARRELPAGTERVLLRLPESVRGQGNGSVPWVSPSGAFITFSAPWPGARDPWEAKAALWILNTRTRRVWPVRGALFPQFTAGRDRYLWLEEPGDRGVSSLVVVDTSRPGAVPVRLDAGGLQGQAPRRALVSPDGEHIYLTPGGLPFGSRAPVLWHSNPAGTAVQSLGPAPEGLFGVAADGGLVVAEGGDLAVMDPRTRALRTLMSFDGSSEGR